MQDAISAPAVGGIPELVDAQTGVLFAPGGGAPAILQALQSIAQLPKAAAQAMRQAAQTRWNERCRADSLLQTLFPSPAQEVDAP